MDRLYPSITIDGVQYPIKFTWGALLALKNQYGDSYMGVIQNGLFNESVDVGILMRVIKVATDVPADALEKYDGPLLPACMAVASAIKISYSGWIDAGDDGDASPKQEATVAQ